MTTSSPRNMPAGERESGTLCPHCGDEIVMGDAASICRDCGAVHHARCWDARGQCSAYECSTVSKDLAGAVAMKITRRELATAQPLVPFTSAAMLDSDGARDGGKRRRWNRGAVAAFIVALLGIPLFGLVTGLVAIVIACVALGGHTHGRRGMGLAVMAIVLGMFDVIGWAVALSKYLGNPQAAIAMDSLTLDPESLDALPERISRAMRANVVIQSAAGLGRNMIGSGVILRVRDGMAQVVTNRHTIDLSYTAGARGASDAPDPRTKVQLITVGQVAVPAKVEWIAPHGVDLAILSAPVLIDEVQEAHWDGDTTPLIGDEVFAVGNPHGMGWTHSAGDISQIRRQDYDGYRVRMIQTTAAINPGNSGGGLYNANGQLIGINTLTSDKRYAEGLGFSISLPTLLDLAPRDLEIPRRNPEPLE